MRSPLNPSAKPSLALGLIVPLAILMLLSPAATGAAFASGTFMGPGITAIHDEVGKVFDLIFWITLAIFVVVWAGLAYGMIRYRYKEGREIKNHHGNTLLEIVWTVIPAIILLAIAIPTYKVMVFSETVPSHPDLTVEIVGHQWFWEYKYPDQHIDINNGPLRVPAGENVSLLITSADVIHDWGCNELGFKRSAIPGRVNTAWFNATTPGTYPVHCYELCGTLHAKMTSDLIVMPPDKFNAWLASAGGATTVSVATTGNSTGTETRAALMANGQQVFTANCAQCHQATGQGIPGAFPPLAGSEIPNGPAKDHILLVLDGKTGPLTVKGQSYNGTMPSWKQLSDHDLASVITYERNSWGNHGSVVTSQDVKALR